MLMLFSDLVWSKKRQLVLETRSTLGYFVDAMIALPWYMYTMEAMHPDLLISILEMESSKLAD